MCDCNAIEMKNLKGQVRRIDIAFRDAEAALSVARYDLADTKETLADTVKTLDKYREMHVKRSRANSELRKSVADLNETLTVRTEERDLARELFQGMISKYADLLDRYAESCDDYDELASRFIWR